MCWVKKAVIGRKRVHAVNLALVMAWIHAEYVVVTTLVVLIALECLVLMLIWIIAVYVMIFQKMTAYRAVMMYGEVALN